MSDESRVYAFADFFRMKPGTIIGGFAKIADSWRLATKWYLPEGLNKRNIIPFKFVTEHDVNWRRKYRPSSKTYGLTRLYRAPEEDLNIPMPAISFPWKSTCPLNLPRSYSKSWRYPLRQLPYK